MPASLLPNCGGGSRDALRTGISVCRLPTMLQACQTKSTGDVGGEAAECAAAGRWKPRASAKPFAKPQSTVKTAPGAGTTSIVIASEGEGELARRMSHHHWEKHVKLDLEREGQEGEGMGPHERD